MSNDPTPFKTLDQVVREHVMAAMAVTQGKRVDAARLLGISRWAIARMLKKWGEK